MIYDFLLDRLNTIPALKNQLYPVAAQIGSVAPPFGLYSMGAATAERTLSGDLVAYTQQVSIDLLHDDYDVLQLLGAEAEAALNCQALSCGDCYIFSSTVTGLTGDRMDMNLDLYSYGISLTVVYWR